MRGAGMDEAGDGGGEGRAWGERVRVCGRSQDLPRSGDGERGGGAWAGRGGGAEMEPTSGAEPGLGARPKCVGGEAGTSAWGGEEAGHIWGLSPARG